MKINLPLMKLMIRVLILMIFFVMIFLISALLYSSRYWPDVYNYINANITIKHIPTLSELNLTVVEVEWTTEFYTTEEDTSTVEGFDFDIDEFTNIQGEIPRPKRNAKIEKFENDYNELPTRSVVVDYIFLEDPVDDGVVWKKIVKDLVDESKLVPKNLGEIEMVNRKNGERLQKLTNICHGNTSDISNIYPWIAAIFIKNTSSNQFLYSCDGALLSDRMLITAARCLSSDNTTVSPDDVLVFLGKTSLHSIGVDEKNVRVSQIRVIIHSNFSTEDGKIRNDLALLLLKEAAAFSNSIRPACLGDGPAGQSGTTAWHLSGALTPVLFEKVENCNKENGGDGTLCATYGNAVTVCPSHGGLLASRRGSMWFLRGVSSDTRSHPGICLHRTLQYTALAEKLDWIMDYTE